MFSRTIVRIWVVVGVTFCLQQPVVFAQPVDAIVTQLNREALAAARARVREGAPKLLVARAGFCARAPASNSIRRRAHAHSHGRRDVQGFKNHELGAETVREGAGHRSEHHDQPKTLSTPGLEEALAEAKAGGGALGAAPTMTGRRRHRPAAAARASRPKRGPTAPSSSGFNMIRSARSNRARASSSRVTVDESLSLQAGPRLPRAGDQRLPRTRRWARPRTAPRSRVRHRRFVGRVLHGGAGRPGPARRIARHRDTPVARLFAAAAKPSKGHADATVERRAARGRSTTRRATRARFSSACKSQRLWLHLGHGGGWTGRWRARGRGRFSGTSRRRVGYWWQARLISRSLCRAGSSRRGRRRGRFTARPTNPFRRRWRCLPRRPGSPPPAGTCVLPGSGPGGGQICYVGQPSPACPVTSIPSPRARCSPRSAAGF